MGQIEHFTAESFLATDQHDLGMAWRYELVDGVVVPRPASTIGHSLIAANLAYGLKTRLGMLPHRIEMGTGVAPRNQQLATVRIPDLLIRCNGLVNTVIDVVMPDELPAWTVNDRRRKDFQDIESVQTIVEIYSAEPAVNVFTRGSNDDWIFEAVCELEDCVRLSSIGALLPLTDIYDRIEFDD